MSAECCEGVPVSHHSCFLTSTVPTNAACQEETYTVEYVNPITGRKAIFPFEKAGEVSSRPVKREPLKPIITRAPQAAAAATAPNTQEPSPRTVSAASPSWAIPAPSSADAFGMVDALSDRLPHAESPPCVVRDTEFSELPSSNTSSIRAPSLGGWLPTIEEHPSLSHSGRYMDAEQATNHAIETKNNGFDGLKRSVDGHVDHICFDICNRLLGVFPKFFCSHFQLIHEHTSILFWLMSGFVVKWQCLYVQTQIQGSVLECALGSTKLADGLLSRTLGLRQTPA